MATTNYAGNFETIKMVATLNATASSGTVDAGVIPSGFLLLDAAVDVDALTTNNELDIGDSNADAIFDGLDPSAGAVNASWHSATAGVYSTSRKLFTSETTVVITNVGAAATPSSDKTVTLWLTGVRTFS